MPNVGHSLSLSSLAWKLKDHSTFLTELSWGFKRYCFQSVWHIVASIQETFVPFWHKSLPALKHSGSDPVPLSSKSSPWLGKSPNSQSLREHTHLNCFFQFYKWPLKLSSWEVFAPIHHLLRVWSHRFFFSDSTRNSLPPGVEKGAGKGQPRGWAPLGLLFPILQVSVCKAQDVASVSRWGKHRPSSSSRLWLCDLVEPKIGSLGGLVSWWFDQPGLGLFVVVLFWELLVLNALIPGKLQLYIINIM